MVIPLKMSAVAFTAAALLMFPARAGAVHETPHRVACKQEATHYIHKHGPRTVQHWRKVFWRCMHQHQSSGSWTTVEASAYGPGLYGNGTACGQTLESSTLGVAHKSLPCGTKVRLRYGSRVITVPVIDRGPYVAGRTFDLTEATARQLGASSANGWGVRSLSWQKA